MSEQTQPTASQPDEVTHLGSALACTPDTVEQGLHCRAAGAEFVTRQTVASEVIRFEAVCLEPDGTELLLADLTVDTAMVREQAARRRRAAFYVIEGGRCDTMLPPPSETPLGVEVRPFGEGEDWAVPA